MTPLQHLITIAVTGPDARAFLHDQLSNDILSLQPGAAVTACYCNPQGRVLDHLLVADAGERLLLVLNADRAEQFLARIRMFVMRAEVKFEPLPRLRVFGIDTADKSPQGQKSVFDLFEGPAGLCYALCDDDPETGGCSVSAWKAMELERGMVWLNEETSGRYLPQMLGFDTLGSINFRKGCYPGQEVVARIRYLGKVKRLPMLLWLTQTIEVRANQSVHLHMDEVAADDTTATTADSKATIVDDVTPGDTGTLLFTVVRDRDALAPVRISAGDQSVTVQRWATM